MRSKQQMNFNECPIQSDEIPKTLIQINADEDEVVRRLNCFVERKRDEIDKQNIHDFIEPSINKIEEENEAEILSCARIRSSVYKTNDSNTTHLKIHRVKNEYGPQTRLNYTNELDKLMDLSPKKGQSDSDVKKATIQTPIPIGTRERLENVEHFLKIKSDRKGIWERLKTIEERILHLESVSPEYKHFVQSKPFNEVDIKQKIAPDKKTYTLEELDSLIQDLDSKG